MTTRPTAQQLVDNWNNLIQSNPDGGNILQGDEFLKIKTKAGWLVHRLIVGSVAISILEKNVPFFGKIWYCPKGPGVATKDELVELLPSLRSSAKEHGVTTIKIEPELDYSTNMTELGLIKTRYVQAHFSTVVIDLSPPLDDILSGLNQKGRHAIRRAKRDGVKIKKVPITDATCAEMYTLFEETSHGAGFPIRPAGYYRRFYKMYGDHGGLFFAYYEGRLVAGAFAIVQGKKSMYKDGASVRDRTAYGASHLLQWEVIKWAKQMGSLEHDLVGVPPIAEIKNPNHPFFGLGRFKTSFNKTVTEYVGAYDLPVKPLRAKLWYAFGEKLTRKLYYQRHHESFF